MAEPKTKLTAASVDDFFDTLPDEQLRDDCRTISAMMQAATKAPPKMWGAHIVGFGDHHSVYANGKPSDWMLIGFSPRKQNIALYLMGGGFDQHADLMSKLGKHSTGKGCLYIKRLSDVDLPTLKKLVTASVKERKKSST